MGMFDSVNTYNVNHDNFKHNGTTFQTKCLDCDMSGYVIFNNQLWKEYDGENSQRFDIAKQVDFSGAINIYTHDTRNKIEQWIEYNLTFEGGILTDVTLIDDSITKDNRDLSSARPKSPSNRMLININISALDKAAQLNAVNDIECALDKIRDLLNNQDATIVYPVLNESRGLLSMSSSSNDIRYVHSVIQKISDFESIIKSRKPIQTPNGDKIIFIADEASMYLSNN
jgi:hypothetical protein